MPERENHSTSGPRPWPFWAGFAVCMFLGLSIGVFFLIIALIRAVVSGIEITDLSWAPTYVGGFLVGGFVAGVLNKLARTIPGAAVVGILAMVPVCAGFSLMESKELMPSDPDFLVATIAVGIIFGISLGLLTWDQFVKPRGGTAPWSD